MLKLTKKIALIVAVCLIISSFIAFAEDETDNLTNNQSFYNSFTGIVKEINEDGKIYLESEDEQPAYFIVSDDTYFVDDLKVAVGMEITGFYESSKVMIMIYPPQISIDIIAAASEDINIKADLFDDNLISADKFLKFSISEETEIVWENGTLVNFIKAPTLSEFEAVLSGRKLILFYDYTTKSIPAQTIPKKIIVLSEKEVKLPKYISVNNNSLNITSYINDYGIVMVPLRAVSEELSYVVTWNESDYSILLNNDIHLKIGTDSYRAGDNEALSLGAAPELLDGRTFVPLSFFREIIGAEIEDSEEINIKK